MGPNVLNPRHPDMSRTVCPHYVQFLALFLCSLLCGCARSPRVIHIGTPPAGRLPTAADAHDSNSVPKFISIFALVVNPEKYHGQLVDVSGMAFYSEGHAVLSVSREAAVEGGTENRIYLDVTRCRRNRIWDRFEHLTEPDHWGELRFCSFKGIVDAFDRGNQPPVEYACTLRVLECTYFSEPRVYKSVIP